MHKWKTDFSPSIGEDWANKKPGKVLAWCPTCNTAFTFRLMWPSYTRVYDEDGLANALADAEMNFPCEATTG